MKGKIFALFLISLVVLSAFVSASFTVSTNSIELSKKVSSTSFVVNNSGELSAVTIPSFGSLDIDGVSLPIIQSATSVPAGNTTNVIVSYSSLPNDLDLGTFSKTIILTNGTQNSSLNISFVSGFCDNGDNNTYNDGTKTYKLAMNIDSIDVEGFGPDDNTWYPADEISIDVDLDNTGGNNADLENINLEVCLYDKDNNECILDEDDMDLSDNDFDLDEGDDTTITISFQLDPEDLDQPGDYLLYVKAFSDDLGEDKICLSDSEDVEVKEDDFAVLNRVDIPETVACGDTAKITADIWNIGDDNNGEEMSLRLQNKELGIDSKIELGDIDEWDKQEAEFNVKIPENAEEKSHTLTFSIYNDKDDLFETDEDKDESVFYYELKVEGNCLSSIVRNAEVSAVLETAEEDVEAGNQIVIKATVKNTGIAATTYALTLPGSETFSTPVSINPATLTLTPGQSQDVLITLKLDDDASGEYTFNIAASSGTTIVATQGFSLSVAGTAAGITGSAIGESLRENWFIWVIVLINVILIIAIIIVAVRISRA